MWMRYRAGIILDAARTAWPRGGIGRAWSDSRSVRGSRTHCVRALNVYASSRWDRRPEPVTNVRDLNV